MVLPPLAQPGDVADRLGRDLSSPEEVRVLALLSDASALVRAYTGQQITEATTTDRLAVRGGHVRFPQRPVTAVASITDTTGTALSSIWYSGDLADVTNLAATTSAQTWIGPGLPSPVFVDVTYTHGYAEVPADIVSVVCDVVARSFSAYSSGLVPAESALGGSGIWQTFDSPMLPSLLGSPELSKAHKEVLDRYRSVVGVARML